MRRNPVVANRELPRSDRRVFFQLIGAVGTICIILIYGFASFISTFATFSFIWLINGYCRCWRERGIR